MVPQIGDNVVVPGCGVGRVAQLENVESHGSSSPMYKIVLHDDKSTIWIPPARFGPKGVRGVMSQAAARRTCATIASQPMPKKRANWPKRQRRYNEQLLSNDPTVMAELLGELAAVRAAHHLSFGERTIYERVKALLIAEVATALDRPRPEIEERMRETLDAAAA